MDCTEALELALPRRSYNMRPQAAVSAVSKDEA